MKNTRREFIKASAIGAAVAATGIPAASAAGTNEKTRKKHKPLDILILGGTGFIGPHMVREALRRAQALARDVARLGEAREQLLAVRRVHRLVVCVIEGFLVVVEENTGHGREFN